MSLVNVSALLNGIAAAVGLVATLLIGYSIGKAADPPSTIGEAVLERYLSRLRRALGCLCVFWGLLLSMHGLRAMGTFHPLISIIVGDVGFLALGWSAFHILHGGADAKVPTSYRMLAVAIAVVGAVSEFGLWSASDWLVGGRAHGGMSMVHMLSVTFSMICALVMGLALWLRTRMIGSCAAMVLYAALQPIAYVADGAAHQERQIHAELRYAAMPGDVASRNPQAIRIMPQEQKSQLLDHMLKTLGARAAVLEPQSVRVTWAVPVDTTIDDVANTYRGIAACAGLGPAIRYYLVANIQHIVFSLLAIAKLLLAWYLVLDLRRNPRTFVNYVDGSDPVIGLPQEQVRNMTSAIGLPNINEASFAHKVPRTPRD